jgi:hypothetical protein
LKLTREADGAPARKQKKSKKPKLGSDDDDEEEAEEKEEEEAQHQIEDRNHSNSELKSDDELSLFEPVRKNKIIRDNSHRVSEDTNVTKKLIRRSQSSKARSSELTKGKRSRRRKQDEDEVEMDSD